MKFFKFTCNGGIGVFWDNVSSVQETARHVLASSWVTFDQLSSNFEAGIRQFRN